MHLQRNNKTVKGKKYSSVLLVESYWDKELKRSRKNTIANLSKCPSEMIKSIEKYLKKGKVYSKDEFKILKSYEFGNIEILLRLSKKLKLDKILGERHNEILAMVFNRLLQPRSKRGLKSWARKTATFHLLGLSEDDLHHDNLYKIMDYLETNKNTIEEKLYKQRKTKPQMILYDITSSYFEGSSCSMAQYGYSRDHRRDKKQIVIGLITDEKGIPITVEIFNGNTKDSMTLEKQIDQLKERFGIEKVIFVFDRGMKSKSNLEYITSKKSSYITAITKTEIETLLKNNDSIQLSLFDETNILDYNINGIRYIACYNPLREKSDKKKRDLRISKTIIKLDQLVKSVKQNKKITQKAIIKKVTTIFNEHQTEKYFNYTVYRKTLRYEKNQNNIDKEELLDGKYVLKSNVQETEIDKEGIQKHYKSLSQVEDAFKDIKNYIDIRPIYHYKEERVKAHVFICFLAYYLLKHLELKLESILEDCTLYEVFDELCQYTLNEVSLNEETIYQKTEITDS